MRFLYVAPRYHTNQIPVMKGLKEQGHSVFFISHYAGKIEDYSQVVPEIAGYSPIFKIIDRLYVKVLHRRDPMARDWKLRYGFPPVFRLRRRMKELKPDLVIIRERSVYSIVTYLICAELGLKAVLYDQSPLYREVKTDMAHRLVRKLTPGVRMTPVMGTPGKGGVREENSFFVPFVMELFCEPERREYCPEGKIRIFTVGKYEERKNLLMMVRAVGKLSDLYDIHLTIAGECSSEFHREYYERLHQYIEEQGLEERVTLLRNLSREEMRDRYRNADLFVIPSTREPASISQLEAMAFSVPVICSDTNGSACYVENGHNGYLFGDNDEKSLEKVMEKVIKEPSELMRMGQNAYQDVKEKYQIEQYLKGIAQCAQCLEKRSK